jgi:transposase InsO family protein
MYWSLISRARTQVGRRKLSKEVRDLIFQMVSENPTWGAPRIHGELLMLGLDVSERTISRWMKRAPRDPEPAKRWLAFLRNHREAIAAMDFFTVPTITFGVLYCFFVISHDRRRILHFNVTRHPTSAWTTQQLREAFPYQCSPKYLILDHDAKYGLDVPAAIHFMKITPIQTSFQSPWQNGVAERWVGSCRRELLDHVIALNERHLKRLLSDYVRYYHDRTHLGLNKETPNRRSCSAIVGGVFSCPRLGGLHHRYDRAE